ncbi:MAG: chemotaxis-specific protein-glutamate methyltransferase CheB [Acidobacteriota bacterium]|nr:chemotaxis-specific protein-glutamate methyltransferase CheB [Acidobacteriota bacterium]
MSEQIHVVIVDDSPFVCSLLKSHLQAAADLRVVGTAHDGHAAIEMVKRLRPRVVTLDLEMPGISGLETLEKIMHECPTPVVVVSGVSRRAAPATLRAIELGAVDFILKYTPGTDTNPRILRDEITAKVRAASRIKMIRSLRAPPIRHPNSPSTYPAPVVSVTQRRVVHGGGARQPSPPGDVIVIGASTGGPVALRELLATLPADFPAAVLIIQHMPAAFTGVLAAQLNRQTALRVKEAEAGERLQPGVVLVAPGGYNLRMRRDERIELSESLNRSEHSPSIDVTMDSIAEVYGNCVVGVVLTGMGCDGAAGLTSIKRRGGRTYAQDLASCVVDGMPQRAIERGVVDYVAPPATLGKLLQEIGTANFLI